MGKSEYFKGIVANRKSHKAKENNTGTKQLIL